MILQIVIERSVELEVQSQTIMAQVVGYKRTGETEMWLLPNIHVSGPFMTCRDLRVWKHPDVAFRLSFQGLELDLEENHPGIDRWRFVTVPLTSCREVRSFPPLFEDVIPD